MFILSGKSNLQLAKQLSQHTNSPMADVEIDKFPNGEDRIWVKTDLKNQDVAVVQSFSEPVDENIIEFTLLVDAAKNLGAKNIVAVIPWLGYSPQDKEFRKGEPISVAVIAKIIQAVGVTSLVTVDIHSSHSLDHFNIPTQEVTALPLFIKYWRDRVTSDHIAIALDKGSLEQSTEFAQALDVPLAKFQKHRDRHTGQVTLEFIEGDVKGKHGIAIDDFVSTGSTRIQASKILKDMGLAQYHDCITHPILAKNTAQRMQESPIDSVLVTNTYPVPKHKRFPKLQIISAAPILAPAIS